jgi:para-nitrobenzyl esterase
MQPVNARASKPIVHTQNGAVRGVSDGQVESFKRLPFAAPPIGKLRWMPPQDPRNWRGIHDASQFSKPCPQMDRSGKVPVFVGDEDCLYLNVFKPSGATGLPVIVFIHGGSQITGSASETSPYNQVAIYDGSRLAQQAKVVVVTLNYRLGPLGYIGHPELSRTSGYGASGNYAYMDQIQALKWVQANIAAFGGDPKNVTLSGHSAGATSVWVLMTSPLSKNLFHRAIVLSGVGEPKISYRVAEKKGKELARLLKCSDASGKRELARMRRKSAKQIVATAPSLPGSGWYNAVVDGKVLTDSPLTIMQRGQHHHVPILQGNVADERSQRGEKEAFDIIDQRTYEMAVKKAVQAKSFLPNISADELLQLYPASDYPSPPKAYTSFGQAYNTIFADQNYIFPSREVLRALSASQREFVGRFLYTHTYSGGPGVRYGASHGFELFFIFDTLSGMNLNPRADEAALVKTFQDTWSYFARTGSAPPLAKMGTARLSWKRYDAQRDNYVIFDAAMSEGDHLHTKQCDFWDEKYAKVLEYH